MCTPRLYHAAKSLARYRGIVNFQKLLVLVSPNLSLFHVLCANCHAIRHYNMRNNKQASPGIAGELEELDTILAFSPKEEDAYNMQFEEI
jgi:hypothetical protein